MEAISDDPQLAAQMLQLLGQELIAVKRKLQEYQQGSRSRSHTADGEIHALQHDDVVLKQVTDLSTENSRLKAELDSLREQIDVKSDVEVVRLRQTLAESDNSVTALSEQTTELEAQLRSLRGKIKRQDALILDKEEALQSLRDENERLQASVLEKAENERSLSASEARLRAKLSSSREKKDRMEEGMQTALQSLRDLEEQFRVVNEERDAVLAENTMPSICLENAQFMVNLPVCPDRPNHEELRPCFPGHGTSPKSYLKADADGMCPGGWVFLPEQTVWCYPSNSTITPVQHALLVESPHRYQYDEGLKKFSWKTRVTIQNLVGQTKDLFFTRQANTYYAGTYTFLELPNMGQKECQRLDKGVHGYLIGRTIPQRASVPPLIASLIEEMYQLGIIHPVCVGMQCVGFNQELYTKLLNDMPKSLKRKTPVPIPIPHNPRAPPGKRRKKSDAK
ncbi:hypothetical protein JAAARDRAFT_42934 [Jaapia argillacea MUCL 33604]|uniref:DUF6697 domain-containing protein n=1 Tax=Jaapia argillacea MUCL 33604 TaxID=933084 RepID=A0A067PFY0_9AGAM|nr:hypothetical protein JAAARDRAFT_42934 [Jaapia argillacea MUCL 33604]